MLLPKKALEPMINPPMKQPWKNESHHKVPKQPMTKVQVVSGTAPPEAAETGRGGQAASRTVTWDSFLFSSSKELLHPKLIWAYRPHSLQLGKEPF